MNPQAIRDYSGLGHPVLGPQRAAQTVLQRGHTLLLLGCSLFPWWLHSTPEPQGWGYWATSHIRSPNPKQVEQNGSRY